MKPLRLVLAAALVAVVVGAASCKKEAAPVAPPANEPAAPERLPAGAQPIAEQPATEQPAAPVVDDTSGVPAQRPPASPAPGALGGTAGYLRTVVVDAPGKMKKQIGISKLNVEIQQYYALYERYPISLDELQEWRGGRLPPLPERYKYVYDPQTGVLDVEDLWAQE